MSLEKVANWGLGVLYYTVLYYTILYTVLYFTVLYCANEGEGVGF